VWSWSPDAGIKPVDDLHGRRWQKSPVHRREHEVNRLPHRAGNAGSFRRTCGDELVCVLHLHTRLRVHRAPGIPCALHSPEGRLYSITRADLCRGNAKSRLPFDRLNQMRTMRPAGKATHAEWTADRRPPAAQPHRWRRPHRLVAALHQPALHHRRLNEGCKQGMRLKGPRLQFGMELHADEPGMILIFDDLRQHAVGRQP
jgi:hypothetical protein